MATVTKQVPLSEVPESWREGITARPDSQVRISISLAEDESLTRRERVLQTLKRLQSLKSSKLDMTRLIREEREKYDGRNIKLNL